jgi:tetratricopeptide (TPR) repeat protein
MKRTSNGSGPTTPNVVDRELLQPLRLCQFSVATASAWTLSRRWLEGPPSAVPLEGLAALNKVASMLYLSEDYPQAKQLWERISALCRKQPDSSPTELATAFHGLGAIQHKQGDLDEAEVTLRKAWEIRRAVHGDDHPETATTINRLAMVLWERHDLDEAESLLRQALDIRRRILGELHPDFGMSLNNLGAVLLARGQISRAEALLRRAVEVRRYALGDNHPDFASSLCNLARVYQAAGATERAIELQRRALEIRRQALGEEHPHYRSNLNTLTELLLSQGDLSAAMPLLHERLDQSRPSMETDHPSPSIQPRDIDQATECTEPFSPSTAMTISPSSEAAGSPPPPGAEPPLEWTEPPGGPVHSLLSTANEAVDEFPPSPSPEPSMKGDQEPTFDRSEPEHVPSPTAVDVDLVAQDSETLVIPHPDDQAPQGLPTMTPMTAELADQIQNLTAEFQSLADPLRNAAAALKEPGSPPPVEVLHRLTACREAFASLREAIVRQGEQIGVSALNGETTSVSGLGQFLQRITSEHSRVSELRRQAANVPERVLALRHLDQEAFAPLQGCQSQAKALLDQIDKASASQLQEIAASLNDPTHPLGRLLELVMGQDALDDDSWATAYETVSHEFGRPLAVAASRAKLVGDTAEVVTA